jgi:hypothetical protein
VEYAANEVTHQDISAKMLTEKIAGCELPPAYRNILCILYAEGIRRRNEEKHLERVLSYCTNPVYILLFKRWLARFKGDGESASQYPTQQAPHRG